MEHRANIFWCTGMSGVGKSTLVEYTKNKLVEQWCSVLILDGDAVREKYKVKLGFGREDVKRNNFYVAKLCEEYRDNNFGNGRCPNSSKGRSSSASWHWPRARRQAFS
jgi:adenylylsulfate kinase-like enzyme